jgi:hypothetical protein
MKAFISFLVLASAAALAQTPRMDTLVSHALQIGLSHLDLFSAVAAFRSAVPGNFESRFKPLLDDPDATNKKLKQLWIGCGRQDPAFERNGKLSELLTAYEVRNTFHATEVSTISPSGAAVWSRSLRCCSAKTARPIEADEGRRRGIAEPECLTRRACTSF